MSQTRVKQYTTITKKKYIYIYFVQSVHKFLTRGTSTLKVTDVHFLKGDNHSLQQNTDSSATFESLKRDKSELNYSFHPFQSIIEKLTLSVSCNISAYADL